MTTELDRLIEAVEAGTVSGTALSGLSYDCGGALARWRRIIADAYRGSLDDAVAMLEALLPGWGWGRMNDRMFVEQGGSVVSARGSNPARALLLAVLRAKLMEASHE